MPRPSFRAGLRPAKRLGLALLCAVPWYVPAAASAAGAPRIGMLQGPGHVSPWRGKTVSGLRVVVTATDARGFWVQDAAPDRDPRTSDGLFVAHAQPLGVRPGDRLVMSGTVTERRPGGNPDNLSVTSLRQARWRLSGHGRPPAALLLGPGGLVPPRGIAPAAPESADYHLAPRRYRLDYFERLEGMRVRLENARVLAPRNRYGDIAVALDAGPDPASVLIVAHRDAAGHASTTPSVDRDDRLDGVVGVLSYDYGRYRVLLTATPRVRRGHGQRPVASIPAGRLGIASYNVFNLSGNAPAERFAGLADDINRHLDRPALLALQEIQDHDGEARDPADAAPADASPTLKRLIAAIAAGGGRRYRWIAADPAPDQDGGAPGANIRQVILFDPHVVRFAGIADRALPAWTEVTVERDGTLSRPAGRIRPGHPAFTHSRKPLAALFSVDGVPLLVIANHFNSQRADAADYGRRQPPPRPSARQRKRQAEIVACFAAQVLRANPHADLVVLGDFNDAATSPSLAPLTAAGLHDAGAGLPREARYTTLFDGRTEALDHIFLSPHLAANDEVTYQAMHINTPFARHNSDHDPVLMSLTLRSDRRPATDQSHATSAASTSICR